MNEESPITIHRYSLRAVTADYLRALAGMALTFGPLVVFKVGSVMVYILAGVGALFLLFGFRTALRHLTHVEVSAGEIRIVGPFGRAIRWRDLDEMSLRYYTTRRDKTDGWMFLRIKGGGSMVSCDSSIDGFDDIVACARDAAQANGIALETGTVANLKAMGFDATSTGEP